MGGPNIKKSPGFRPAYVVFDISKRQNWAKKPKPINPVEPENGISKTPHNKKIQRTQKAAPLILTLYYRYDTIIGHAATAYRRNLDIQPQHK